jgi:hypothetical protein
VRSRSALCLCTDLAHCLTLSSHSRYLFCDDLLFLILLIQIDQTTKFTLLLAIHICMRSHNATQQKCVSSLCALTIPSLGPGSSLLTDAELSDCFHECLDAFLALECAEQCNQLTQLTTGALGDRCEIIVPMIQQQVDELVETLHIETTGIEDKH